MLTIRETCRSDGSVTARLTARGRTITGGLERSGARWCAWVGPDARPAWHDSSPDRTEMLVALEIMLPETAAAMIPAVVRRPQAIPDELPSRARTRVRALLAALTRDWRIERVEPGGDGLTVILGDGVERVTLLIRNGRLIRWTDGNGTHDGSKTTMRRVAGIIENTEP